MEASEREIAEFVAARWRALTQYGYLLTGSTAKAEDLVQEALLRTLPRWHRVDSAEHYVRKVMARLPWKAERRIRRERERPQVIEPAASVSEASARAADVAQALDRLPDGHRVVVILRYWQDLSETEIADVLGCRRGTVKSRASRAYAQLREDLALSGYAPSTGDRREASAVTRSTALPRNETEAT